MLSRHVELHRKDDEKNDIPENAYTEKDAKMRSWSAIISILSTVGIVPWPETGFNQAVIDSEWALIFFQNHYPTTRAGPGCKNVYLMLTPGMH